MTAPGRGPGLRARTGSRAKFRFRPLRPFDRLDPSMAAGDYRIGTVARLTGLDPHTIRAWERRYGAVEPRRTEGGTRLYGDLDIQRLRMLKAVTDLGDGIGVVAGLSDEALRERLAELRGTVEDEASGEGAPAADPTDELFDLVSRFDEDGLAARLRREGRLRTPSAFFREVGAPLMAKVGDAWEAGELSVAHEHMASEQLHAIARGLLETMGHAATRGDALLACIDEEQHSLPLLGVGLAWAELGLRVRVLGTRTPPEALAAAVRELRPAVVGLSMTRGLEPKRANALLAGYADACGKTPWIVGGRAAAEHAERIREHGAYLADGDGAEQLRQLLLA